MNRYQLEPPEILRYEQTADDVVCFYIKRPYGALTNAVTRYRVRWKNGDSSEEWIRLFENPNATRLEIDGLKNGQSYEFYFESGSRVRFGKPLNFGKVVLQIFNENRMKMFKRRSSIFARLSNPIKFSSKVTRGIYIAFMAINHNEVLTTADEMLPLVRVDKFTTAVNDLLTKWLFRLPRSYCDLIIFQRMSEECTTDETSDNEISTERQILRTLILLLSLTCYKKFDYYHFAPVHFDEAAVIVVGASGPSEFGLQWTFLDSIGDDELKSQLLKIGQLNEELNRQLQPGLYVADFRLVSDVKQIYVKTSTQRPAFLPCAFIRPNPHMTSNEWSWLKVEANENSTDNTNGEQLEFYRKFFPAVDELLERHKYSTEYDDYCVYNDFLLEYGRVSMILIYPGPSKVVEFENVASKTMDLLTQLVPEYLRQIAPLAFEKYAKVRSFIPMFKEIMKTNKTKERRFRIWHSSVQQNIADAEKMLSKFEAEVCWLKQIVSNARKAGPHLTSLRELQQRYELIGILCYTPNFLGSKTKPSRISVVITFPSLYPVGTTMLIQLKPETTAVEIVQLMMQRCFTKTQLKHMSANDFYLSILYGARERRLREAFEISALDEPWIDGEFCLKCCNTQLVLNYTRQFQIISMLAEAANVYLEPVIITSKVGEVNWGIYVNGSFTGVLGMLEQFKADTTAILFQYVEERKIRNVYITKPKMKSVGMALWNAFKPYQPVVWMLMLVALTAQCGFATLVARVEYRLKLSPTFSPFEKCWQYLKLQVHQSMDFLIPFRMSSGNFSFVFYSFVQATLFLNLYSDILLYALIRGEDPKPWDSFDSMIKLVQDGEYKFFKDVVRSNTSHTRKIYQALRRNPVVITETIEDAFEFVDRGGYIFPTQEDSYAMHVSTERCNYYYSIDKEISKPAFFLFSQRNPLLPRWNEAIRGNEAFIGRTFRKYFTDNFKTGKIPICQPLASDTPESQKPLDLMNTFGIFLILLIGWSSAGLAFTIEWMCRFIRDSLNDLSTSRAHRHLYVEPWTALTAAKTFYVDQPFPNLFPGVEESVPRWWWKMLEN
ncbi:hypothetical protein M3Y96_00919800 [Aphelenchoides besseyi]|nr:hypothetical protein M3Y96_00919800 [Aphelenchoides besseyi]